MGKYMYIVYIHMFDHQETQGSQISSKCLETAFTKTSQKQRSVHQPFTKELFHFLFHPFREAFDCYFDLANVPPERLDAMGRFVFSLNPRPSQRANESLPRFWLNQALKWAS